MIVVDTSGAMAILFDEPGSDVLAAVLDRSSYSRMSAGTLVELGIVLESRIGPAAPAKIAQFLRDARIEVVAVDRDHADRALEGWRRFGKGRHRGALNLGDCFTYALASTSNLPILCVGDDFVHTDAGVVPL
ncbi:MAG: type II toxin-antitoxin system VapC family toxin [Acidimicrobiia bacterium]